MNGIQDRSHLRWLWIVKNDSDFSRSYDEIKHRVFGRVRAIGVPNGLGIRVGVSEEFPHPAKGDVAKSLIFIPRNRIFIADVRPVSGDNPSTGFQCGRVIDCWEHDVVSTDHDSPSSITLSVSP